jgi:DNA-binding HxlR family transcriptional regulator
MFNRAFIKASPVNRALDVIGDRWLIMILQQAWFGTRRFDDFQARLEIARSTLTSRLRHLVDHGVMERHAYSERPPRYEYRLTDKGLGLFPAAVMSLVWQQRWALAANAPAVALRHRDCGRFMEPQVVCGHCREPVDPRDVEYRQGPGAQSGGEASRRRRRSTVEGQPPSRTMVSAELLELLGDRWTPQVAATAFFGLRRFEDMREALQLAPNILSDRLRRLVELDIFRTEPYQSRPLRLHYRLTDKGRAFYPILLALMQWAECWYAPEAGAPLLLVHRACGQPLLPEMRCSECGGEIDRRNVLPVITDPGAAVALLQQRPAGRTGGP